MPFAKTQMDKAYFKRFQVKYRRRRLCKTDYYQRRKLVVQAKNKYNTPKYRLVVRKTASRIICQIVSSTITGDNVLAQADTRELKRYGLTAGLKNYCAAYCAGLLVGRRLLQKLGLFELYTGTGDDLPEDEVTGEIMKVTEGKRTYFVDEVNEDKRPFRCYLDIGLHRTSLGCTVFGALKGASDAGLDIPHSNKKLTGYDPDSKEFVAEEQRDRIFGAQVKEYMEYLKEDDAESGTNRFGEQFRTYGDDFDPDTYEELLQSVHKAIREDPSPLYKESAKVRRAAMTFDKSKKNPVRLTKAERDARMEAKKAALREAEEEEESDDDSDEEDEDEEDDE